MKREQMAINLIAGAQSIYDGDLKRANALVWDVHKVLNGLSRNTCAHDGCQRERELYSRHCKEHGKANEPPI